jgi:hypothetical protein
MRCKGLGNMNSVGLEGLGKQRANYGEGVHGCRVFMGWCGRIDK